MPTRPRLAARPSAPMRQIQARPRPERGPSPSGVDALQEALGVRFRRPSLLRLALTHRSVTNELPAAAVGGDNERLEFLGDAVLGAVVADELYRAFPEASEGALTVMRAQLVRRSTLAQWARRFALGDHLIMSRGEARAGGARQESALAGCFEAVIGAIYLDRGERAVRRLLQPLIAELAAGLTASGRATDPKSELQHRVQAVTGGLPQYRVVNVEGPDHDPCFTVEVVLPSGQLGRGSGRSKQAAEQEAARQALAALAAAEASIGEGRRP